jgi:hypothetical protein
MQGLFNGTKLTKRKKKCLALDLTARENDREGRTDAKNQGGPLLL